MSSRSVARSMVATVAVACLVLSTALPTAATQGNQGLQGGWAVDPGGHINFPHSVMSELPYMQQAGAGVLRLNFRLNECFRDWTSASCSTADGATALAVYDQVVNAAINTYHLQLVGLLSNEAWHGTPADWTANNAENTRGNGDNPFIRAFARNAAGVLAQHYAGQISTWEVWNEPNAWTSNPSPGAFTGGSFVYPSNFAWLLTRSYAALKAAQPGAQSTVISGGLFGHDLGGAAVPAVAAGDGPRIVTKHGTLPGVRPPAGTSACTSAVSSGADYLCHTYLMGKGKAGWRAGAYPLDRIGQHLYIDQVGLTSGARITSYLDDVRKAYLAFEGSATAKKTEVTEFGWVADQSSTTYTSDASNQAQNVRTAYTTFRSTRYVSRADYFVAQDVPEGGVLYGLVQGDGTTKPAFAAYQASAVF